MSKQTSVKSVLYTYVHRLLGRSGFFAIYRGLRITPVIFYTRAGMQARRTRVSAHKLATVFVATTAILVTLLVTGIIGGGSQPKASAAPADTLNFQARLQTSSGAIVPDGTYSIQFKLYNSATGGSSLWTETNSVSVVNGYVSVYLGANTPFPSNVAWDQTTYVTMNVNSDGEMSPRLKLTAVPYSFMAKYANQLQASNGSNIATLSFTTPTATNTILLPDASGTVCLTATCIQNSTSLQTGNFAIASAAANSVTATIQGNASQSANILEIKNGAGNTTGGFNSSGQLFNVGGSFIGTIAQASLAQNVTYTLPDPGGATATICLTTGNCAGTGGGITGSGTTNYVARFNSGSTLNSSSLLYDNNTFVGVNTTADNGQLSIVSSGSAKTGLYVQSAASASTPTLVIKGGATPGAGGNLVSFQNSAGSTLSGFNSSGQLFNTGGSFTGTIAQASLAQNVTYTLPDPGGATATICLTTGNCAGTGGGITGSGTAGTISKFTGTGSTLGNSNLTESGSTLTYTGDFYLASGANRTLGLATQTASNTNGNNFTLQGGNGLGTGNGGDLTITAGAKGASGTNGGSVIIKPQASNDSTTAFQIQNAAGTSTLLAADTTNGTIAIKNYSANESATLGSELLSTWTNNGSWSNTGTNAYRHLTASTTPAGTSPYTQTLTNVWYPTSTSNYYQVSVTVTNRTAGSYQVTFGGYTSNAQTGSASFGHKPTSILASDNLVITPTLDFDGYITVSVKQITGTLNPTLQVNDSAGSAVLEVRTGGLQSNRNSFVGYQSGYRNTTGYNNSAFGYASMQNNTTGYRNQAFGYYALNSNTSGVDNVAFGTQALQNNTTGIANIGIGSYALYSNTTASSNIGIGYNALYTNSSGALNVATGYSALSNNTSGSYNTASGSFALRANTTGAANVAYGYNSLYSALTAGYNAGFGYYSLYNTTGDGNTGIGSRAGQSLTTGTNNTFVGYQAGNDAVNQKVDATNSMALGYSTYTTASNQTVLGNSAVTQTLIQGTPTNDATTSLLRLGSALVGANSATNGGTYLGINKPSSSTGSAADFINFQNGGTSVLSINSTGAVISKNSTDSSSAFQIQNAAGTPLLNANTTNSTVTVRAGSDTNATGTGLITTTDFTNAAWTSTGWTTTSTTATNNASNTTALSTAQGTVTSGSRYLVQYTVNNAPDTSSLTVSFNGQTISNDTYASSSSTYTYTKIITASGTGNTLSFTPSASFAGGYISNVQVYPIASTFSPTNAALVVSNASGTANLEVRASSSTSNTFIGLNSGQNNNSGTNLTVLGSGALANNTTGSANTAIGYNALNANTSGTYNTAIGPQALQSNTVGTNNTAIGNQALYLNTVGRQNVAIGPNALRNNTAGYINIAIGDSALYSNQIGRYNIGIGTSSLYNTTGTGNIGMGYYALQGNTTGGSNVAIGYYALAANVNNTTSNNNLALGTYAGTGNIATNAPAYGNGNSFIGSYSVTQQYTNAITNATALGFNSIVNQSNTVSIGCVASVNGCTVAGTNVALGSAYAPNALTVRPQAFGTFGSAVNGTISQSGSTTITGSGTTFTSGMTGGTIYYPDGTNATVTYVSATSLTSSVSKTINTGSNYTIVYNSGTQYYGNPLFSQSGTTLTVTNGTVTSGMVGGTIYYKDGTTGTVSSVNTGAGTITSSLSKSVTLGDPVTVVYGGFNVTSTGTAYLQPSTDSTSTFQIQNASATALLTADTTNGTVTVKNYSANESLTLGSELLGSWTNNGNWTGSGNAYTHTAGAGNTQTMVNTLTSNTSIGTYYQVTFGHSGSTAGSFTISVGGVTSSTINWWNAFTSPSYFTVPATASSNLVTITPSFDFNGTVTVSSVKAVTTGTGMTPTLKVNDSAGTAVLEVRSGGLAAGNNTFIGVNSGRYNNTGTLNTGVGYAALASNTSGTRNTALGVNALTNNTAGMDNIAIGQNALQNNTTGWWNLAIGNSALSQSTNSSANIAIGTNAGQFVTGNFNTITGWLANQYNTGSNNTSYGYSALRGVSGSSSGSNNTSVGYNSLYGLTTGATNTAVGSSSLQALTSGGSNAAFGSNSGINLSTGSSNVFVGVASGNNVTTSSNNSFLGASSGRSIFTGANNSFLGYNSGYDSSTVTTTTTSATTSSTTLPVTSATGIVLGQYVSGTGIAAGTYVAGISGLNITLSAAASVANGASVQFGLQKFDASNSTGLGNGALTTADNQMVLGNSSVNQVYLQGSPTNSTYQTTTAGTTISALLQMGGRLTSSAANTSSSGGTYIGINAPSTGAGSAADFVNLQANGTSVLRMTSTGATTFRNTTDSSSAFVIQNASATPILTVDTTANTSGLTVRNQSGNETATLGSEILGTWTSTTGWTGSTNTWTHTTGNTNGLVNTLSSSTSTNTYYQVTFTNTGGTGGSFTMNLGGATQEYQSYWNMSGATQYMIIKASSASNLLTITPTSTFNGTVSVTSVKPITGTPYPYNSTIKVSDSAGTSAIEVRTGGLASLNNTFIGVTSGQYNTQGLQNTGLGYGSMANNTTGLRNSAGGYNSLNSNTTGYANTAFGWRSMQNNTSGYYNTAYGADSLQYNTSGYFNTGLGLQALNANTTGNNNVGVGINALYTNTTGNGNTALGTFSMSGTASTASFNTATGGYSLYSVTSGNNNTANGYQSLYTNTTGTNNTAVGYQALYSNASGTSNAAFGAAALKNATGSSNTAFGNNSLNSTTTGFNNTAVGDGSLFYATTANNNSVLGNNAGKGIITGSNNSFVGNFSGYSPESFFTTVNGNTTSSNTVIIASGTAVIGQYVTGTGISGTPTVTNVAGTTITLSSSQTLSNGAGLTFSFQKPDASNSMALGNNTYTSASNQIVLGNSSVTQTLLQGTPAADATTALLRLGSALVGANSVTNGGTYLGINSPSTGAGSAADYINFQQNGTTEFKVDSAGNVTALGTITAPTVNATTALQLNGANINTAGTLNNVAYLNGTNNFSAANTFSAAGTALSVTNNATISGTGTIGTLSVTNAATIGTGLTVTTGGITVTGNSTITGTLSGLTGLTVASGGASISGGLNNNSGGITNAGAISGITGYTQTSGNFGMSGTGTFGTGTGTVSLNGATSVTGTNSFTVGTGTVTLGSLGAGVVQSNASGVLSSSNLGVSVGGTGATTLTSNGILYGNGTGAIQATASANNSILATDGTGIPSLTQTLPTAVQGNITSTGALASGSIASGFGTISTANNITTSATVQGDIVNAVTGYRVNGTATAGNYLRGNGTNFVSSAIQSSDISGLSLFTLAGTTGTSQAVSAGDTINILRGSSNNLTSVASATDTITIDIVGNPTFSGLITSVGVNAGTGSITGTGGLAVTGNSTITGTLSGLTGLTVASGGASISGGLTVASGGASITGATTINTTGTANTQIGNATGTFQLDSNALDISSLGVISGATGITSSGTITFTGLGAGVVQSSAGGVLSSSAIDRNSATLLSNALNVSNGGTGTNTLTSNGILYGNGTNAIQATAAAANSILATNGSNVPSLTQTLPTAVQGNITGTGALASGSIASGFGTISTANNITTSATVQGGTVNATSVLQLNGTDINTAGTLSNVAYENQANIFTQGNTFNSSVNIATGSTFTNASSTLFTAIPLTLAASGAIGANTATVDVATTFNITASNAGLTFSLPTPTASTAAGRIAYINNVGSTNSFTIGGITIPTGGTSTFVYTGSGWASPTAVSGSNAIGTLDGNTKSANGASILGNSFYMQTADASFPGLVSTGTQTFAGAKTFSGAVTMSSAGTALSVTNTASIGTLSVTNAATIGTGLTVTTGGATISAGGLTVTAGGASITGTTTINTTGTANTSIGNATGTFQVTSSGLNVSTAGALSGITGYTQSSGNFAISGAGSFSTGTGSVLLNGNTSVAAGKNLSLIRTTTTGTNYISAGTWGVLQDRNVLADSTGANSYRTMLAYNAYVSDQTTNTYSQLNNYGNKWVMELGGTQTSLRYRANSGGTAETWTDTGWNDLMTVSNTSATFKNGSNSTTGFQIQNASGTNLLVADTTNSIVSVRNASANESLVAGSELLTNTWTDNGNWNGANTNSATNTFQHITASGTAPYTQTLTNTWYPTSTSSYYQVSFTVSGRTAGSFSITMGGQTSQSYTSSSSWTPKPTSVTASDNLVITPTANFDGTIVFSVKQLTVATLNPTLRVQDSAGSTALEVRTGGLAGSNNIFLGVNSGRYNTTGTLNVGVGGSALRDNISGFANTAVGNQSMLSNSAGNYNTATGYQSLFSNNTGLNNSAFGVASLYNNSNGINNTGLGMYALYNSTTASNNTAVGYAAMQGTSGSSTGSGNVAVGTLSLYTNSTGGNNTSVGSYAMQSNTTSSSNAALGYAALYSNQTSNDNVAIGTQSMYFSTSSQNTAVGRNALYSQTTGSNNTGLGYQGGRSITTGSNNTFVGYQAGYDSSAVTTTTTSATTSSTTLPVTSATGIALGQSVSGTGIAANTYVAGISGLNITLSAAATVANGASITFGIQKFDASNTTAIGNGALSTANNQIVLGNSSVNQVNIQGNPSNSIYQTTTAGTTISGLLQLGNRLVSSAANTSANGGTYFGINAPSSGAGSAADFLNFQANGTTRLQVTSTGATTVGGLLTASSGLTVNTGSTFTNASSSLFTAKSISNLASGGAIDTAANSVDVATSFNVNQTTTGQTLSLPSPTVTTAGRIVYVNNIGTADFTMHSVTVRAGTYSSFVYNGSAWIGESAAAATTGGSGVTTVGSIDSQTKSVNGAVISGTTIYLQNADATNVGLVSTGTQTFAGAKTFNGAVTLAAAGTGLSVTNSATIGTGLTVTTGGITVTGNSTITGTLSGLTGLTVASGGASISGGLNNNSGGITNAGAISGASTISASGAITAATTTNTINGLIINAGALSGITGYTQTSGNFGMSGTGTFGTGTGAVSLNGNTTVKPASNSSATFQVQNSSSTPLMTVDSTNNKLTLATDLVATGAATATTATTSGTGTNTTTLTFSGTTSFANGDVIFIDNVGQDYYTRITAGANAASVTVSPAVTFETGRTVTKYTVQNIGAVTSTNSYTTLNDRFFQGYFLGGVVTGAGSTSLSDGLLNSTTDMNFNSPSYLFKPTSNAVTAFQIQPTSSTTPVFNVDTTNSRIGIGNAAPTTALDVTGAINASTTITAGTGLTVTSGGAAITGNSTINTTGSGTTQIGNASSTTTVLGATNINSSTSSTTNIGNSSTYVSDVNIYGSTGINTGSSTANTSIGNNTAGTTTTIRGTTLNINSTAASTTTTIGNSTGTLQLTSNAFNLTSGGAVSGVTGYTQSSGNFAQNGSGSFSTGTGNNTLNGNVSISGTNTFATGSGAVSLNGDVSVASGKTLTVSGTGATSLGGTLGVTGATTLTGLLTVANGITASSGQALGVTTANASGAASGNISITTGNVTSGAFASGSITIDSGTSTGTTGTVGIGTTSASAVNIGSTNVTTTVNGALAANGGISTNNTNINAGTGTITSGAINGQTISSSASFTGTVAIQGANALTLGTTGTNTGSVVFRGNTAASGTLTLQGPNNPSAGNYTLSIPAITGNANICTDNSVCTGYAPSATNGYVQLSPASQQTGFININGAATFGGAISAPTSTNTINNLVINNGALSNISTITTSSTINGQTISSAANFTGTLGVTGATTLTGLLTVANGIKSSDGTGSNAGTALSINGGNGGSTSGSGGNVTIVGGNAQGGTSQTGGNITINAGTGFGGGASGTIGIGSVAASSISIGNSNSTTGITGSTTVTGTLGVSGTLTASNSGATALSVSGAPTASATSSLIQIGSAIAGGNNAANGGTYIGVNAPLSGAGSAADYLHFQQNGVSEFRIDSAGNTTAAGLITGNAGLTISGAAANINQNSNFATNINTGTSTGTVTIGNTGNANNAVTLAAGSTGGINLNSATIATNQSTVAFLNTTATSVNAFGAATTLNIGGAASTITFGNTGAATLQGVNNQDLVMKSLGTGVLSLQGGSKTTGTGGLVLSTPNNLSGTAGTINIDTGSSSSGTSQLNIGTANAGAISIGRSGITTTFPGNVYMTNFGNNDVLWNLRVGGHFEVCSSSWCAGTNAAIQLNTNAASYGAITIGNSLNNTSINSNTTTITSTSSNALVLQNASTNPTSKLIFDTSGTASSLGRIWTTTTSSATTASSVLPVSNPNNKNLSTFVGRYVSGTGIPAGTYIASANSTGSGASTVWTSFNLTANATVASGATVIISSEINTPLITSGSIPNGVGGCTDAYGCGQTIRIEPSTNILGSAANTIISGSFGSFIGNAGSAQLQGGDYFKDGCNNFCGGNGGDASIYGGYTESGNGGYVYIVGGSGTSLGGDVTIDSGTATSAANNGTVYIGGTAKTIQLFSNTAVTGTLNVSSSLTVSGTATFGGTYGSSGATRVVSSTGALGVGANSTEALSVKTAGLSITAFAVDTSTTAANNRVKAYLQTGYAYRVCANTDNGGFVTLGDCTLNSNSDYAENYPIVPGATYGDIVVTGNEMVDTYDKDENGVVDWNKKLGPITKLIKSSVPYQNNTIGIVSNNYGDSSSVGYNIKPEDNPMPVALNGRVPVNIAPDSAPIEPGDFITTSGTHAGKGTKATGAGYVVGKALEAWDPASGKTQVMVFVQNGFYPGPSMTSYIQNGASASLANLEVTGTANFNDINMSGTAVFNELKVSSVTVSGNLEVKGLLKVADIEVNGHVITKGDTPAIAAEPNAGKDAVCSVTGNDTSGKITITTGTANWANGTQCTITFSKPYGANPNPVITPAYTLGATTDTSAIKPYVDADTTKMRINFNAADNAPRTYIFNYFNAQ